MAITDSERLVRMERGLGIMITAMHELAEAIGTMNATINELADWLKKPPSDDLPDAIRALLAAVQEMRVEVRALPGVVARAVADVEIDGRG